jgi:hypothetical protein
MPSARLGTLVKPLAEHLRQHQQLMKGMLILQTLAVDYSVYIQIGRLKKAKRGGGENI